MSVVAAVVEARCLDLGLRCYDEILCLQRNLVADRQADRIPDTLILVEHPDVITLGRAGKQENILNTEDIPLFSVERGGDVTYHGPGQIVAYPIFLLREYERDLHQFLRNLEEAVILTLADFGITGTRENGRTGVWTLPPPRKLASIGIAIRKWVCMHGLALNVNPTLSRFSAINPCGMPASVMTSMDEVLGKPLDLPRVKTALVHHLARVLNRKVHPGRIDEHPGSG